MFGIKKKSLREKALESIGDALEKLDPVALGAAVAAIAAVAVGASAVANEVRSNA